MLEFSPITRSSKNFQFLIQFYFMKCLLFVWTSVVTKRSHYLWWPLVISLEWRHIYSKDSTQPAAQCINLGKASASCANRFHVRTVILTAQCLVWVGAKTGIYLPNENGGGEQPGYLGTELMVWYLDHLSLSLQNKS